MVTIDAKRHKCIVALPTEAQGSFVACDEVVTFVKDELRLPSGALYDLRTAPDVDEATRTHVRSDLNSAGFRPADGAQ